MFKPTLIYPHSEISIIWSHLGSAVSRSGTNRTAFLFSSTSASSRGFFTLCKTQAQAKLNDEYRLAHSRVVLIKSATPRPKNWRIAFFGVGYLWFYTLYFVGSRARRSLVLCAHHSLAFGNEPPNQFVFFLHFICPRTNHLMRLLIRLEPSLFPHHELILG